MKFNLNLIYVKYSIFFIGFIVLIPFLFFDIGGSSAAARSAGVALILALFWVTECIPLPVTALLPLVLHPVLGIATPNQVAKSYFNDTREFIC